MLKFISASMIHQSTAELLAAAGETQAVRRVFAGAAVRRTVRGAMSHTTPS